MGIDMYSRDCAELIDEPTGHAGGPEQGRGAERDGQTGKCLQRDGNTQRKVGCLRECGAHGEPKRYCQSQACTPRKCAQSKCRDEHDNRHDLGGAQNRDPNRVSQWHEMGQGVKIERRVHGSLIIVEFLGRH